MYDNLTNTWHNQPSQGNNAARIDENIGVATKRTINII